MSLKQEVMLCVHSILLPLYRSNRRFDRMFHARPVAGVEDSVSNYPPYKIERASEKCLSIWSSCRFTDTDSSIETKENS